MARILVIDDDIDFLMQQKIQIEADGHEVSTASTAEDAEKLFGSEEFDLVVVDLMIDEFDTGFTLCHRMKKAKPDLPVIMVTAVTSETGIMFDAATHEEQSWVKADALLPKPVRFEQLKREMDRLLKK